MRYQCCLVAMMAGSLASCVTAKPLASASPDGMQPAALPGQGSVADVESAFSVPAPFRWRSTAIPPVRVTLATRCVLDGRTAYPCDIEVTGDGRVFYRDRSPASVGIIASDISLHRAEGEAAVFALDAAGALVGLGFFQGPDSQQLLFCRLTAEPALRCRHELKATTPNQIWNQENCNESFVAQVDGGAITLSFPAHANAPLVVAARIEPVPIDDTGKALALFLYAMHVVDRDTDHHTPFVDDVQYER